MVLKTLDISVLIQGPVDQSISFTGRGTTRSLIESIRRLMPAAQIILSTWNNQDITDCRVDSVVLNNDPGPQSVWPSFMPNNVNRQILSTKNGLKKISTEYCLKIRSDMILVNTNFLTYFFENKTEKRANMIFDRPIVSNNLSSRASSAILNRYPDHPIPFHPSDHAHFGLLEDLKTLWTIPLQPDEDSYYFLDRTQPNRWRYNELSKLTPEQYICTSAIKQKLKLDIAHYADNRPEISDLSRKFLSENFQFIPDKKFGIHFSKYHTAFHDSFDWMRIDDSSNFSF